MNTLVTGGGGFIGSNLVAHLLRQGHNVRVLDNFSSGYQQNLASLAAVDIVEGDVRDSATVHRAVAGCDVIFHLAASVGNARSLADPITDSEVNVLGTLHVLQAAVRSGVQALVYSSSAGVYGELRTLPIDETHPLEPETPYGVSKLAGERHCIAFSRFSGLRVVALRYFNVYGVNQRFDAYGNVIPIFVERLLSGEPLVVFGDGEQTRDFINVSDVVQANYLAAIGSAGGVFNLGSGNRISINALVNVLRRAAGGPLDVRHDAPRPGDVRDSLADIDQVRTRLGFEPRTDLEAGIQEYVAWAAADRANMTAAIG